MERRVVALQWYGGKARPDLQKWILSMFPRHDVYVEVFGGGGSLLLNKTPSAREVYNDLNRDLVNFFLTVSDPESYGLFHDFLIKLPHSRRIWYEFRDGYQKETRTWARAAKWFYMARHSYNGFVGVGFSTGLGRMYGSHWPNAVTALSRVHHRLHKVTIENLSYEKLMPAYDSPTTFFYCDPPYMMETRSEGNVYKHEFTDKDHRSFLNVCKSVKGMVMISGYANDLYRKMLKGWDVRTKQVTSSAAGKTMRTQKGVGATQKYKREEVLWLSPTLTNRSRSTHSILENP